MAKIHIFDTTLRDGEQSPGVNLMVEEKIEIAEQLARLNVDVIEAGFPITSQGDRKAVSEIGRLIKGPMICALARTHKTDIDAAAEALKTAESRRIHVFTSSSDVHIEHMLRRTPEQVIEMSVEAVRYARQFCDEVEFSGQDAARTRPEFLYRLLEAAIDAGARVVNIPDTVGYAIPDEFAGIIRGIRENVPNIDKARISVHTHNDLGLAVANALAAVKAGAEQVECTINGIGERAGNCSLEEVVMALATRSDWFGHHTEITQKEIYPTSRLVAERTGMMVQANKAIVGANAFSHEAGIHQDGVLKERTTYEIIRSEDIGYDAEHLVLGKHSGRHAFSERLKSLGYTLSSDQINELFFRFKGLTDRQKRVSDEDIQRLVTESIHELGKKEEAM